MKAARLVVLTVAIAAGGVAAMLAGRSEKPAGGQDRAGAADRHGRYPGGQIRHRHGSGGVARRRAVAGWPAAAAAGNFIRRTDRPNAIEQLAGNIARVPFVAGEPIREAKLVNAKGSGFMAAILPTGMRAISTQISPETGAGGFILPNDHVDVILTRRDRDAEKQPAAKSHISETILTNVRVLAIDQNVAGKERRRRSWSARPRRSN